MVRASGLRLAAIAIFCGVAGVASVAGVVGVASCGRPAPVESSAHASADPAAAAPSTPSSSASPPATTGGVDRVRASFRHVNLHVDDATTIQIRRLEGVLVGRAPGRPPAFDDEESFTLEVRSAEIAVSADALTRLVNRALTSAEAPLTDVEISIDRNGLRQKGTLKKGVHVPFTIEAVPTITDDGRIRLHPKTVKAAGVPAGGLMKLFGLELDDLVKLKSAHGLEIVDNDVIVDARRLLPSPRLEGRLTGLRLEPGRLVEIMGTETGTDTIPPAPGAINYMAYRGGSLRFGKLTMSDADLQLIDADPSDPFDIYPARYVRQLVAGYSKNTPSGGLRVQMPDYDQSAGTDLRPPAAPSPPRRQPARGKAPTLPGT